MIDAGFDTISNLSGRSTEQKKGRIVAVLGGHGDVEVQAHCKPDGVVSLKSLAISGFLTIRVPRVWDDSERRVAERDPRDERGRLARRVKTALDEWTKSVSELATWIRYSPPPQGAKPVEPWFDDRAEDVMTAGRRRHTDWTRSDACVVCCESPLAATSSRLGAYSFSAPSSLPRLRSNVPSGR